MLAPAAAKNQTRQKNEKTTAVIFGALCAYAAYADTFITVADAAKTYQTIDCFGASDAWSGAFIGKWQKARDDAARMLFSPKFDKCGNPEGIGLTLWRFNMGGGPSLVDGYPIVNGDVEGGGAVEATKILWGLGNYSFFIRPGFKRIDLAGADDMRKVFASAYIAPDGKRIVQVYVNPTYEAHSANIEIKNWGAVKNAQVFRTDCRSDLANTRADPKSAKITITPRSITTVVLDR